MPPYGGGYGWEPPRRYYTPPPRNPWRKPVRRNANIACFGLIILLALGLFLSASFSFIADFFIESLNIQSPETVSLIRISFDLATYILMFIMPISIMRLWIGIPSKIAFPMRNPRASIAFPAVLICIGASILGALSYGVIQAFMSSFFNIEPIVPTLPEPAGIPATALYIIWLTLIPAILEELMFRGVIMQSLRRFGDGFALVCSSILFSLAHHNLVQGPNAFLLGLVIGFFTLRTGSLKTAMLMHFVNNLLAVTAELLSRGMVSRQQEMLGFGMFALYVVAGIAGIVIIVLKHGGIFHLAPPAYPLRGGKKYAAFFCGFVPILYIICIALITSLQFQRANWY